MWNRYKNYIRSVVLPANQSSLKRIAQLRNELFCSMLIYVVPISIFALVPGVFMSFKNGIPVLGICDLIAFALLIVIMTGRTFTIEQRKFILMLVFYLLSVILLYYVSRPGSGMLYLLALTVIASMIYSSRAAYYSAIANTIICLAFAILLYAGADLPIADDYSTALWITISSNLITLSFLLAVCSNLLIEGLEKTIIAKNTSEANLASVIENSDATIYSLDKQFRYITFNKMLRNQMKEAYNLEVNPGDAVFDFLEKSAPQEALEWRRIYEDALTGKSIKFEREFSIGDFQNHTSFSINPIFENKEIIGLSCFVTDITELKNIQKKLEKTQLDLEDRVAQRTKELLEKNTNILASINYAKRIQVGLLTHKSLVVELFPKSFIFSMPKDIISGDFFWCYQGRNKKFIVLADCTGHGVPGALMSIIGNNLLDHIIVDEHIENPSEILQLLDARLTAAIKGDTQEVKDGMDISLCVVDTYFKELYFAGAYQPIFISDEIGNIQELAASRYSIGAGMQSGKKVFETRRFPINPGQRIYLSSDGYYSQFGGPDNKKLMKSLFRKTLEELQAKPIDEHKNSLRTTLAEWAGLNEQVDDILVVGIEL